MTASSITVSKRSISILKVGSSLIFIVAGLGHLMRPEHMLEKLGASPIGQQLLSLNLTPSLIQVAGLPLVLLGLGLSLGWRQKWMATGLLLLLIPITIVAQVGAPALVGGFFKNIAIGSVLVFFILNGDK